MTAPCCSVGARPDAAEIAAALLASTSTREIARLFGTDERPLSQSAVVRHRPHVMPENRPAEPPESELRISTESAASRTESPAPPPARKSDPDAAQRAVDMAVEGKSAEEIGAALGLSTRAAAALVERGLTASIELSGIHARAVEIRRCCAIIAGNLGMAKGTEPCDPADRARLATVVLKAGERIAKLLGLDAPRSLQVSMADSDFGRGCAQFIVAVAPQAAPDFVAWCQEVQAGDPLARNDPGAWVLARRRAAPLLTHAED